jgi:flagellar hook-length control protein FliK
VVSVTSDIASNVSFAPARSKSVRDDKPVDAGSFSAMIDNNTANSAKDRPDSTLPEAPSPSRDDQRPAKADDSAQRRGARADAAAASDARNQDAQTKAASDRADANDNSKANRPVRSDSKPDNGKLEKDAAKDTKDPQDGKDATTADAAAVPAATDTAVPIAAVAVVIPVATATVDTAAVPATNTGANTGATAPLAIAAAVLKAQAAAAEATAATGTEAASEATTPATTDPDFAALIAAATPAAAKTAIKQAKPVTEATTTENTVTSETTEATTGTTPQPQATATEPKAVKTGSTGEISADGAKPESGDAVAKPAVHAAREHATPDATQIASTDAPQPTNTTQPPLPTTAPIVATAPQFTATLAANTPVPLNGVAVEIAQSAQSGKSRFDIRLDPAELGRIDVRLDVDRDGNVTSHLTVEKPETLAMLRQDAPQLQRALEQAGMKTSDGGLQFSLRDQSQGQQQNNGDNSGRPSQRLIISEDDSIPAVSVGRNYGRMLGSSRGIDISI